MEKKFKIIGLSLLLVAFGWECFAKTLADNKIKSLLYEMHQKIDRLWECEYADFAQIKQTATIKELSTTNDRWKSYEQIRDNFASADEQEEFGQILRLILYVSGSICLILAEHFKKDCLLEDRN